MNGTDPNGMTCFTQEEDGQMVERCVVDKGRENWTDEELQKLEASYTDAVKKADEAARDEPPRVCRRLRFLRDWGHEQEAHAEVPVLAI